MSLLDSIVDSIVERHNQLSAAKYLAVVSWTLLGYDWIISIDLEAAGLSAGFFFALIITIFIVKLAMDEVAYFSNPLPDVFTGCLILLPRRVWTIYVIPLIYDTTLFGMTVHRIWILSKEYGSTPLMGRLAKNGALHSAVLIALMLFSCLGGTSEAVKIASNASGILGATSSVVCSRIIFSLHALAEEEAKSRLPSSRGWTSGGDTRFAVPMRDLNTFGTIGTGLGRETDQAGEANQPSS
ncbi:hypothetical protein FRC06_000577 [Ceratobasidium sp. 370]|nr:hypothetical protein FRC06_000577 [Ceratobasidium sp. 370]